MSTSRCHSAVNYSTFTEDIQRIYRRYTVDIRRIHEGYTKDRADYKRELPRKISRASVAKLYILPNRKLYIVHIRDKIFNFQQHAVRSNLSQRSGLCFNGQLIAIPGSP